MDAAGFEQLAPSIDEHCDVKFRYSLLAGPPPFEWVAGHKPTITAEHVSNWFATELQKAEKESTHVPPSAAHAVACIGDVLGGNVRAPLAYSLACSRASLAALDSRAGCTLCCRRRRSATTRSTAPSSTARSTRASRRRVSGSCALQRAAIRPLRTHVGCVVLPSCHVAAPLQPSRRAPRVLIGLRHR